MILSQRESTQGLLSHFMNSPSDCFVSQSDDCASFDRAFERDAVEAGMSNTSVLVCVVVKDVRVFQRETSGKIGEFSCPRNPHNPSLCKLFRPAGGFPSIIIMISQSFHSPVARKCFRSNFSVPFHPLKPVISLPPKDLNHISCSFLPICSTYRRSKCRTCALVSEHFRRFRTK